MNIDTLTSDDVLKIQHPGLIFTNDLDIAKKEYHKLIFKFHSDLNGIIDENVTYHINMLYEKAKDLLKKGIWEIPGIIEFKDKNTSSIYKIRYKRKYSFELGDMYISDTVIVYIIRSEYKHFYRNGIDKIKSIKYANSAMKDEFSKYVPDIVKEFETVDGLNGLILKKTADVFLLRDVLNYFNGKIDSRHVAWIMSTLHNITCFLQFNNFSHCGITLDTYFISPQYHSGMIYGGWWYCVDNNSKMIGCPSDIYKLMSSIFERSKISTFKTDLESIRYIGRLLLGDSSGSSFIKKDSNIPVALSNWLKFPASDNARNEYSSWDNVLTESFGPRKFVKMEVSSNDIYK